MPRRVKSATWSRRPGSRSRELALGGRRVQDHRLARPVPGLKLDQAAVIGGEAVEQGEADLEGRGVSREPAPQGNVEKEVPLVVEAQAPLAGRQGHGIPFPGDLQGLLEEGLDRVAAVEHFLPPHDAVSIRVEIEGGHEVGFVEGDPGFQASVLADLHADVAGVDLVRRGARRRQQQGEGNGETAKQATPLHRNTPRRSCAPAFRGAVSATCPNRDSRRGRSRDCRRSRSRRGPRSRWDCGSGGRWPGRLHEGVPFSHLEGAVVAAHDAAAADHEVELPLHLVGVAGEVDPPRRQPHPLDLERLPLGFEGAGDILYRRPRTCPKGTGGIPPPARTR